MNTYNIVILCSAGAQRILLANVFYSEVVYNEGELDGARLVRPQSWCCLALRVSVLLQAVRQQLLRNNPRLRQAIHSLLDLAVDVAIWSGNVAEFVMLYYIVGHVQYLQLHAFISCHWGIQIKVFYVHGHEFCSLGRYDAVDQQFDGE
jgi:hypothetical protein